MRIQPILRATTPADNANSGHSFLSETVADWVDANPETCPFSSGSGTSGRWGWETGSLISENLLAEIMRTSTILPMYSGSLGTST